MADYPWILSGAERSRDPAAAKELAQLMSDLSEEAWFAGWLIGTEFELWRILSAGELASWGGFEIHQETRVRLRSLSDRCGGWIVWRDGAGETFVPMDEWLEVVAKEGAGHA